MAVTNSYLIIINAQDKTGRAFKAARKNVGGLEKALGGATKAMGALGLAMGAREVARFTGEIFRAANEAETWKNTLSGTLGSVEEYNRAMDQAKTITKGMVDETTLAANTFLLLDQGLAKTTQDAAQLIQAGNILVQNYEAQGASQEKFIRLLSTGNKVLLDNFGLSQKMVAERQKEIEATGRLSGDEARLQAVRELAIEQSQKLEKNLSEGTVRLAEQSAAWEDLKGTLGSFIQGPGGATVSWATALTKGLKESLTAILNARDAVDQLAASGGDLTDLNIAAAMGATPEAIGAMAKQMVAVDGVGESMGGFTEAASAANAAILSLHEAQAEAIASAGDLTSEAGRLDKTLRGLALTGDTVGFSSIEEAATRKGLEAMAQARVRTNEIAAEVNQERLAQQEADEQAARDKWIRDQEAAAQQVRGVIESVLQPSLDEVWQPPEGNRIDEWARRMATVATGGLASEWLPALQQQFGGMDFFQPIAAAMESGDSEALKQAATNLLTTGATQLWDKDVIIQRVKQQLEQDRLREQLVREVQAALGAQGITADEGLIGAAMGGGSVLGDLAQPKQDLQELATAAGGASEEIAVALADTAGPLDDMNTRLLEAKNLLGDIKEAAGQAAGNIGAMGAGLGAEPAGGGVPGFQHGGSFTVGGRPGVDRNLVMFRASRGEQVNVSPSGGGGRAITIRVPVVLDGRQIAEVVGQHHGKDAAVARRMGGRAPL